MTIIIDGKKIRDEILETVKKEVADLPFQPVFCDVAIKRWELFTGKKAVKETNG